MRPFLFAIICLDWAWHVLLGLPVASSAWLWTYYVLSQLFNALAPSLSEKSLRRAEYFISGLSWSVLFTVACLWHCIWDYWLSPKFLGVFI